MAIKSSKEIEKLFKGDIKFVCGSCKYDGLLNYNKKEIAFVGRSNVGKSSLINAIFYKKNLAKTSKTPGRTQAINLFNLEDRLIVADIPGYGFAKIPDKLRQKWDDLLYQYFVNRSNLECVFILIDSRRGMMDIDMQMIDFLILNNRKFCIILTKVDLVKDLEVEDIKSKINNYLLHHKIETNIFLFSIKNSSYLKHVHNYIINTIL